jgi:hypothetical protein
MLGCNRFANYKKSSLLPLSGSTTYPVESHPHPKCVAESKPMWYIHWHFRSLLPDGLHSSDP